MFTLTELSDFWMRHKGETCIIAGVGPNLHKTPPQLFGYPSFGVNTIYRYEGWMPTYYVGVDHRLMVEDGSAVAEAYPNVPKFIPRPDWDSLQTGSNFYRFAHRPGSQYIIGGQSPMAKEALTTYGITYFRIMDAVFQIAAWMGFTTLLCIGMEHKPNERRELFWGHDHAEPENDFYYEEEGYKFFSHALPVRILNISADTYVPEDVLPRDDWKNWITK